MSTDHRRNVVFIIVIIMAMVWMYVYTMMPKSSDYANNNNNSEPPKTINTIENMSDKENRSNEFVMPINKTLQLPLLINLSPTHIINFDEVKSVIEGSGTDIDKQIAFSRFFGHYAEFDGLMSNPDISDDTILFNIAKDNYNYYENYVVKGKMNYSERSTALKMRQGYKIRVSGKLIGFSLNEGRYNIFLEDTRIIDYNSFSLQDIFKDKIAYNQQNSLSLSIDEVEFIRKEENFGTISHVDITLYNKELEKFYPTYSVLVYEENDVFSAIKQNIEIESTQIGSEGFIKLRLPVDLSLNRIGVVRTVEVDVWDRDDKFDKKVLVYASGKFKFS